MRRGTVLDCGIWLTAIATLLAPVRVVAQLSPQMHDGITGAAFVPAYSSAERAIAIQKMMSLAVPPSLGLPISLTPNAPYAPGGAHLSFWKPSFVLGTAGGGEAGVNFWGLQVEGHINVGFTAESVKPHVLDCRLLSAGRITYKLYAGTADGAREQGERAMNEGHFLLVMRPAMSGESISVELWPTPITAAMGFLGCEISTIEQAGP